MATAQQVANRMQQRLLDAIEEELQTLDKALRKYEPLIEQKNKLTAARRALLSERSPTPGGGRGLTQEEVVKAMTEPSTVDQIATKLSATPGSVRAHLNRGNGERFESARKDGVVLWSVRNPEDEEEEEDDE